MKVISMILCLFITVFAQNEQYDIDAELHRKKIQKLVKKVTKKQVAQEIQKEALYLSPADREYLYEKNKKEAAVNWAALNFFPGFGLGSYIQGDIKSGVRQSVIDGIGFIILYVGMLITTPMVGDHGDYVCDYECHYSQAKGVFVLSYAVLIFSRIYGLTLPFAHQKEYNEALKSALNSNDISYSIDPLIVPKKEGPPAIGLAYKLLF